MPKKLPCLEDVFEEGRPRQRQISQTYDPDSDDYQMVVTPELPEVIELEEKQLTMEQIAKLQHRIDLGGRTRPDISGIWSFFLGECQGSHTMAGPWREGERDRETERGREKEREREINIIKYSYKYGLGSSWMLSTNDSWSKKRGEPEIIEHYQKAWLWAAGVGLVPLFPWWLRCRRRGWRNCRWRQPVTASWASSQRWTRWPHAGCAACRD